MNEREKFEEMKAKAEQVTLKKWAQRQFDRAKYDGKASAAAIDSAWRQLDDPSVKPMSPKGRPAEKIVKDKTRGMKKKDADYLREFKASRENLQYFRALKAEQAKDNDKSGGHSR